jgi:alkylation response protein AidB-like acyl-CoA dehydrogenase
MALALPLSPRRPLQALPPDEARQVMWRFSDRVDLQMLVQSARAVARGPVAQLVASGGRNSHEWTPGKAALLEAFDASGLTAVYLDPADGGFIEGPKNLALALAAFELAWVDAGAATGSLAGCLALAPIHERGTPAQRDEYMRRAAPVHVSAGEAPWRGAFCLTEPIPYVGVETGLLSGRATIEAWTDGEEPLLRIDKRGRFITNMGFANFVTAAVDSGDPRIKGSCMVVLEEGDPGLYDRGTPTRKLVHQLSSTSDPVFSLVVPASRIIGGYTVVDGVIVPRYSHGEIIEAVFRRTRVTVGVMTVGQAALGRRTGPPLPPHALPRRRARRPGFATLRARAPAEGRRPASPHRHLGHRRGERVARLRRRALFDELDPLEREKDRILAERGVKPGRPTIKALAAATSDALEYIDLDALPAGPARRRALRCARRRPARPVRRARRARQRALPRVQALEHGSRRNDDARGREPDGRLRHHRGLPGLPRLQVDGRPARGHLRGPEAVQRRQLSITMTNEVFLGQFRQWIAEMRAHRQSPARHRRLHARDRHGAVALDPRAPAAGHRRRRRTRSSTAIARASPSRSPTRSAGCSPRGARSSMRSRSKSG